MLASEFGDDFFRAAGAGLLVRVKEHSERTERLELLILQQLQRVQNHRYAALGICHPRAIGTFAVESEGTLAAVPGPNTVS